MFVKSCFWRSSVHISAVFLQDFVSSWYLERQCTMTCRMKKLHSWSRDLNVSMIIWDHISPSYPRFPTCLSCGLYQMPCVVSRNYMDLIFSFPCFFFSSLTNLLIYKCKPIKMIIVPRPHIFYIRQIPVLCAFSGSCWNLIKFFVWDGIQFFWSVGSGANERVVSSSGFEWLQLDQYQMISAYGEETDVWSEILSTVNSLISFCL